MDGTIFGLNADVVTNMAAQNGGQIMQDPRQQMDLQYQQKLRDAQAQQRLIQENAIFAGQQNNQGANLNTQRAMALNAQANAAQNVSNQLNQLGQARTANTNAILGAMQSVGGLYK
jgi:hypothetical protein